MQTRGSHTSHPPRFVLAIARTYCGRRSPPPSRSYPERDSRWVASHSPRRQPRKIGREDCRRGGAVQMPSIKLDLSRTSTYLIKRACRWASGTVGTDGSVRQLHAVHGSLKLCRDRSANSQFDYVRFRHRGPRPIEDPIPQLANRQSQRQVRLASSHCALRKQARAGI